MGEEEEGHQMPGGWGGGGGRSGRKNGMDGWDGCESGGGGNWGECLQGQEAEGREAYTE